MKKNRRLPGDRWVLLIAFLACAMVLGVLLLEKYNVSRHKPPVPPPARPQGTMLVTLFFATPDGLGLVREGREIEACGDTGGCIAAVVRELVNGPVGNLSPTLPPAITVRGARVEGEIALVDMGEELVAGLPGGSDSEMTALYSIIDTVTVNFPQVKRVKLLVNGNGIDTLKGHLDLREPLSPDYSLERK